MEEREKTGVGMMGMSFVLWRTDWNRDLEMLTNEVK